MINCEECRDCHLPGRTVGKYYDSRSWCREPNPRPPTKKEAHNHCIVTCGRLAKMSRFFKAYSQFV